MEPRQNEFGYFGKLPARGDFIQQILPQDFANHWHEWLQQSMASARQDLGNDFLTYYLNCPAWKFLMAPGVCGLQAVAGLTIPSVDKVGRYFNFTLATMLPAECDPCAFVMNNGKGMLALENLALDMLECDFEKEEIDLKVRDLSLHFEMPPTGKSQLETQADEIQITQDAALPFAGQASALLSHLVGQNLGQFSIWWYGQAGQTHSQMIACRGMPAEATYLRLLTMNQPPTVAEQEDEMDYIDKIIAGEA